MLPHTTPHKSRFEDLGRENPSDSLGPLAPRLQSPYSPNHKLLSPHRQEALANYQCGNFSPSTPPVSRQRRHSKMHLRIASELSVDQGECSYEPSSSKGALATIGGSASAKAATKERYRIVILGSSAVGKTAIVEQFLYGSFPETHCCTVEELHKGEYEIAGGGFLPLEILDTSGSFEFPAMRNLAISKGDAFALVYSIDQQESFEEVKNIREMILQVKGTDPVPPIVVVGNKCDLDEEKRQVKMELAECECIDWEHGFVECSAKNNKNIVNIFSCMLIQARLKGSLNVDQISTTSNSSRHIGYRDHSRAQRRRSSLPISELFHRSRSDTNSRSDSNNRVSDRSGASFRKRNSCTPS